MKWGFYSWGKPADSLRADEALAKGESVTLRMARYGLLHSVNEMAKRMSITASTYKSIERNEATGAVTIKSLRKAAEAMDCELIVLVRPKNRERFIERVWNPVIAEASQQGWLAKCYPRRRGAALAMICNEITRRPSFRLKQGWNERRERRYLVDLLDSE